MDVGARVERKRSAITLCVVGQTNTIENTEGTQDAKRYIYRLGYFTFTVLDVFSNFNIDGYNHARTVRNIT